MPQTPPFSFTCLEINGLTPANVDRVCAYARRFNIGAIGYMGAEYRESQFLDHTKWGVPPVNDGARLFMADYQKTIREASERVTGHGLDFYLWRRDLRLPVGFVEKYGVEWIDFENPQLWELLRWNIEEVFRLFPATRGLFLSCTGEQKAGEWISANGVGGALPLWQRFEKMFRTVQETCDRLGRRVIFRNHGIGNEAIPLILDETTYLWHFLKAAAAIGKETIVMGKAVEPDYQATYPFNSILAPMAQQQPTLIEFSLPMEYNAVGRTPFPMVEDIKFRLQKAREIGCWGAVARIDWHMTGHRTVTTWSCLDTFNEINAYAFGRLINEPATPPDVIYADFARERFGERAAATAASIFRKLPEAGAKTYYELGTKGCRTPSGAPIAPNGMIASLRRDHLYRWSFSPVDYANYQGALAPDFHFIRRIQAEKNQALAIYREALQILDAHREEFRKEDADKLELSLRRAAAEAEIRRDEVAAFHSWLAYDNTGDDAYAKLAAALLDKADLFIAQFRKQFDPMDAPDLDARDAFLFGANAADTAVRLRERLEESRRYWETTVRASSVPRARLSGWEEGALEIPLATTALIVDPGSFRILGLHGDDQNLLGKPVSLAVFQVGGLKEESAHLGRSFIKSRIVPLVDGREEASFEYGHHGMQVKLFSVADQDAWLVRLCHRNLPFAGVIELPWLQHLGATPRETSPEPWMVLAAKLGADVPRGAWSYATPKDGFVMIDVSPAGVAATALPSGLQWKAHQAGEVACVMIWAP
jgi:hypothetical protein